MYLYYVLGLAFILIGFFIKGNFKIGSCGLSNKKKKLFIAITFGIMIFLSAFKSVNVGTDTIHYYGIFNWLISSNSFGRYEPGFALLNVMIDRCGGTFQSVVITSSLVMFIPFAIYIYQESEDVVFSTLIFYALYFISFNTMMRQGMAMGISAIALLCCKHKKYVSFLLLALLAFTMHQSAFIILVFPILLYLKYQFHNFFICIIIAYLMGRFDLVRLIINQLNVDISYATNQGAGGINAVMLTMISFVTLVAFYCTGNTKEKSGKKVGFQGSRFENSKFGIWSIFIYTMLNIMTLSIPVLNRFGSYFEIGFLTFLPNKLANESDGTKKILVYFLVIFMYGIYQTIVFIYRPLWGGVFPYSFCWSQ